MADGYVMIMVRVDDARFLETHVEDVTRALDAADFTYEIEETGEPWPYDEEQ